MLTLGNIQSYVWMTTSGVSISGFNPREVLVDGTIVDGATDGVSVNLDSTELTAAIRTQTTDIIGSVNLSTTISTASSTLTEQESLLREISTLALTALDEATTSTERETLQIELEALVDELDAYTSISVSSNEDIFLDGSYEPQIFQLAPDGVEVELYLPNTQVSRLGRIAEVKGLTVSTTALTEDEGELVINGVEVDVAISADDLFSTASKSASAIAVASAINRAGTGVLAEAQATVVNLGQVSAGRFASGALMVNGVDIGAVDVEDRDASGSLVNAINQVSDSSGVTARVNTLGEFELVASSGANIVTAGADTNGGSVFQIDPGDSTYGGTVVLSSGSQINITGDAPDITGLLAGTYAVSASVATLDLSTQEAAESATRVIDAALAEIDSYQDALNTTAATLEQAIEEYLDTESEILSRAKISAEPVERNALQIRDAILSSFPEALKAQTAIDGSHILSLL